jgi:5'-nucleotidase
MTDLPRILMTNDDGIDSAGLLLFARELAKEYDVVVAAPSTNMSGAGTSIGRFDPEKGVELNTVKMDGYTAHTIAGPPGLAVMAAALGAFGRVPDLVVSGINAGINTGHSVIHSGTVGGALTARTFGSRGIAISLAPSDPWQWETAVSVGVSAVRWMIANEGSPHVLNINVPAMPIEQVAGTRWAELDEFGYFQVATTDFTDKRLQFAIRTETAGADPASDTALCASNYVTVTPLSSIEPAPFPDIEPSRIWSR